MTQAPLLALFAKYKDAKGKQAKLKSPAQLQVRALQAYWCVCSTFGVFGVEL